MNKRTQRPSYFKRSKLSLLRRLLYFRDRLVRQRSKSEAIARGLAVGVFAGFFPLFGLQMIIGIILATIIRGNKFAAAAGTWVSNPLTYIPIYVFNFGVGKLLLGHQELSVERLIDQVNSQSSATLIDLGFTFIAILFAGCFVVGAIAAIFSYFFSLWLLKRWRDRQRYRRNSNRFLGDR